MRRLSFWAVHWTAEDLGRRHRAPGGSPISTRWPATRAFRASRLTKSTSTMRTFAALRNTTGADITVPISWQTNLGSDAGTTVVGSSSGDLTFGANDVWLVTSDEGAPEGDPVNTSVLFGPGNPAVRPSSVADLFTGCGGDERGVGAYKVTVPPGPSCHLLFFNQ